MLCYCTVAAIAILYVLFDVNYFIRIILTIAWGRVFQNRKKILEQTTIYGEHFYKPVNGNGTCVFKTLLEYTYFTLDMFLFIFELFHFPVFFFFNFFYF